MRLKILAFSDLHDDEDAVIKISKIAPNFDLVLGCGDLCESNSFYEDLLSNFSSLKNFYFIPGNIEGEYLNSEYKKNPSMIHKKRIEIQNGLNVAGFGYSLKTSYGTYGEIDENEFEEGFRNLNIDNNSILLLHSPPFGHFDLVKDVHVGSKSALDSILLKNPLLTFFGHVHARVGFSNLNSSCLIKLPPANSHVVCSVTITSSMKGKNIYSELIRL